MFRIPDFYEMKEMTVQEATRTIERLTSNGGLLEGMQYMNRVWDDYIKSEDQDDDDFYYTWQYEVNAYNVIFEGMGKLFGEVA